MIEYIMWFFGIVLGVIGATIALLAVPITLAGVVIGIYRLIKGFRKHEQQNN